MQSGILAAETEIQNLNVENWKMLEILNISAYFSHGQTFAYCVYSIITLEAQHL